MSADCYIFLKTERFPQSTWSQILELFCAEEIGALEWFVKPRVWLSVKEIGVTDSRFGTYRWRIGIHYPTSYSDQSSDDVHKYWVSVAVPYHCLVLMEQATYDENGRYGEIDDAAELKRYAETFLIRSTSLQKLVKYGYMDAKENLTLDVANNQPLHPAASSNTAREP
jgi:hypothetical protein